MAQPAIYFAPPAIYLAQLAIWWVVGWPGRWQWWCCWRRRRKHDVRMVAGL